MIESGFIKYSFGEKKMLIQLEQNAAKILLNGTFYSINAVIAANTQFQDYFLTEVSFTLAYISSSPYHTIILKPKKEQEQLLQKKVYAYVNAVLHHQQSFDKIQNNKIQHHPSIPLPTEELSS